MFLWMTSPTIIEESLMNELQLEGEISPFHVQYANGKADCDENSKVTSFYISASGSSKRIRMDHVDSVTKLDLPTQVVNARNLKKKYRYLSNVPIRNVNKTGCNNKGKCDYLDSVVDMLI